MTRSDKAAGPSSTVGRQMAFELPSEREPTRRNVVPVRSALETAFPGVVVSQVAEAESWRKEIHRPATHTHKWWAQRLGTVFRAILASALSETESEAIEAYAGRLDLDGLVVYDPFAGSGTTLVEAAKVGAGVVGRDINPVATLVQRQALQGWDISLLEKGYRLVEDACRAEIDQLHVTEDGETVLYYFWVAICDCPDCGLPVQLFSRQVYAQHAYPKRSPRAQIVCPVCLSTQEGRYDFSEATCRNGHPFGPQGAVSGAWMTCPTGHRTKVVAALGGKRPRLELYATLVLDKSGNKHYRAATDFDRDRYAQASSLLESHSADLALPQGALEPGYNTRQALNWGYRTWADFFNDRQLYCLGLLGAAIRALDIAAPEREALATLFSGTLEFNNLFCSFKGEGTGAVRHMFSHHVLKPERTPLEAHPWGTPASSGSFSTLFTSRLMRADAYKQSPFDLVKGASRVDRVFGLSRPLEEQIAEYWPTDGVRPGVAYVTTGDSAKTDLADESVSLIVTDPPFMDNVHYSELSDFFHAWLRAVHPFDSYPTGEPTTRYEEEVQSVSPDGFESGITAVWRECARVLRADGLLAFTFHQARSSGWLAVMRGLRSAGFVVTAVQPVKAEMSTGAPKSGASEPSNLDAIVVARKSPWAFPFATSLEGAAAQAIASLENLQRGGVIVGAADVRSVVRGSVFSVVTVDTEALEVDEIVRVGNELADAAVGTLIGTAAA
ncbi:MAG: DNA methyltransferase [Acidimicrobiales bacterium]